jgi:hypothetical protein
VSARRGGSITMATDSTARPGTLHRTGMRKSVGTDGLQNSPCSHRKPLGNGGDLTVSARVAKLPHRLQGRRDPLRRRPEHRLRHSDRFSRERAGPDFEHLALDRESSN